MKRLLLIALLIPMSGFAGVKRKPVPPKPAPSSAPELFKLIESKDSSLKEVQDFLRGHKVYMTDETDSGQSLLLVALLMHKVDVFNELYHYFGNPDPNYFNPKHKKDSQYTIYSIALNFADWNTIVYLRGRGGDFKKMPSDDSTLTELMAAAVSNSLDVVQHLVAEGNDVHAKDKDGTTVLMYAAQNKLEVLQYILGKNGDVMATNDDDMTALLYASCDPGVIHTLIAAGSDLKHVSLSRTTAMQRISECDDIQDFDQAFAAIPNVDFQDAHGRTALYVAAFGDSLNVTKQLIARHANLNLADQYGMTPLMIAAKYGVNPEVMKTIIEAGADLNLVSKEPLTYFTALMYAAGSNRNPEFTRMLTAAGADLNYQETDFEGDLSWTALMVAAVDKLEDNVIVLVKAGADTSITTKYGNRAYDYAVGVKMSQSTLDMLK